MKTPIFEAFGQPAPAELAADSAASWAGVQTPSPAPTEGLRVTPLGRSTRSFLTSALARSRGFAYASSSLEKRKTKPLAEDALVTERSPSGTGSKLSTSQSVTG